MGAHPPHYNALIGAHKIKRRNNQGITNLGVRGSKKDPPHFNQLLKDASPKVKPDSNEHPGKD